VTNRIRFLFQTLLLALAALAAPEVAEAQAVAPLPDDDNQIWTELQVFVALDEKTDLVLLQYGRFGFKEGFRSDARSGAGVRFNVNKLWSIQPTYVYQYAHPGDGRKTYSHRLFVDNNVRIPFKKFSLPNRVRAERLVRHGRSDAWNFRIRPGIDVPVTIAGEKLTLFANTEVFYDTGPRAWTRNRLMAGVTKKFNDLVSADFFYLQQNDRFSIPGEIRAFGTIVKLRLR
jgi:hypothetical protein